MQRAYSWKKWGCSWQLLCNKCFFACLVHFRSVSLATGLGNGWSNIERRVACTTRQGTVINQREHVRTVQCPRRRCVGCWFATWQEQFASHAHLPHVALESEVCFKSIQVPISTTERLVWVWLHYCQGQASYSRRNLDVGAPCFVARGLLELYHGQAGV